MSGAMSLWSARAAAKATGGNAVGEWSVSGLSIDTRSIQAGELFVPLKDQRDGHDFIPMALRKGAVVMSERPMADVPALLVGDSLSALESLGAAARDRSKALRIAVTGSVGKTSVKEMVAAALSPSGATHKSIKSFNNHWGVPLMLASMPKASRYGVFEAGMNHSGELSALSAMIKPHIAIITKIASAHLENFDNVDGIAAAKAEIFDGMEAGGTAILPADDDYFDFLSKRAKAKGLNVIAVGKADIDSDLSLRAKGDHHYTNAAFALAAVKLAKGNRAKAKMALSQMGAVKGRGETFKAHINGHGVTVIDESYNANPESMRAAIMAAAGYRARKVAVLGDMKELGPTAPQLHAALLGPLQAAGFERVITVGADMQALRDALPLSMRAMHATDKTGVAAALKSELQNKDVALFKASNSVGLGSVIDAIKGKQL